MIFKKEKKDYITLNKTSSPSSFHALPRDKSDLEISMHYISNKKLDLEKKHNNIVSAVRKDRDVLIGD
jgi:hypothetical protein